MTDNASAMADLVTALRENAELAAEMVAAVRTAGGPDLTRIEKLAERAAQKLTVIRLNVAVLGGTS